VPASVEHGHKWRKKIHVSYRTQSFWIFVSVCICVFFFFFFFFWWVGGGSSHTDSCSQTKVFGLKGLLLCILYSTENRDGFLLVREHTHTHARTRTRARAHTHTHTHIERERERFMQPKPKFWSKGFVIVVVVWYIEFEISA